MQAITGRVDTSNNLLEAVRADWQSFDNGEIQWKNLWDFNFQNDFRPNCEHYSGMKDGRILATHEVDEFSTNSVSRYISLYDHRLNLINSIQINERNDGIWFHVAPNDKLYVLTSTGILLSYFGGRLVSRTSLGTEAKIVNADFWDDGLIYIDGSGTIYAVYQFLHVKRLNQFPDIRTVSINSPKIFKAIPPEYNASDVPIVFLCETDSQKLKVVNGEQSFDVDVGDSLQHISFSAHYKYAAFIVGYDNPTLIVTTSNMQKTIFRTEVDPESIQLSWLGDKFPVVAYDGMVSAFVSDDRIDSMTVGFPVLFTCTDSILVCSSTGVSRVSVVTREMSDTINTSHKTPSSRLLDCFASQSTTKVLSLLEENKLQSAVDDCIQAALTVDDVYAERFLMFSASYGRAYLKNNDNFQFSRNVQLLRTMNIFKKQLSTLVTPAELSECTGRDLIARLCNRQKHALAMQLAEYLQEDRQPIVTDWCCAVLSKIADDDQAYKLIEKKSSEGFDASAVANEALLAKRDQLASRIESLEISPTRAIDFFVGLGRWEDAIASAVRSGDPTMMIEVFEKVLENCGEEEAASIASKHSLLLSVVAKMVKMNRDHKYRAILKTIGVTQNSLVAIAKDMALNIFTNYSDSPADEILATDIALIESWITQFPSLTWLPDFLEDFKMQAKLFTTSVEIAREKKESAPKKTLNMALEEMYASGDLHGAIKAAKAAGFKEKRMISFYAQYFVKKNDFIGFKQLAGADYKKHWEYFVGVCAISFSQAQLNEFIDAIPDPKKQEDFKALVSENQGNLSSILFNSKSIKTLGIFKGNFLGL